MALKTRIPFVSDNGKAFNAKARLFALLASSRAFWPYPMLKEILVFFFLLMGFMAKAQMYDSVAVPEGADSLWLSNSNTVYLPGLYFTLKGDTVNLSFRAMPNGKGIRFLTPAAQSGIMAHFRLLPYDLSQPIALRPIDQMYMKATGPDDKAYDLASQPPERPFEGLQRSGSLSRGLRLGTNQNPVLNSQFNLQLSGQISENTQIRASVTENSLPAQSGGFSQSVREFDQIYIEIENPKIGKVRAGDIDLESNGSQFLNFQKRLTGGWVQTAFKPKPNSELGIQAMGALARGRFHRNVFFGQEGNQGPYRLNGAYNEAFILIISGSERVYLDGVLMKRGADADYTLDYTTGEITFTPLRPIVRERRISVEFQYTDRNYLRSALYGSTYFKTEDWQFYAHAYSEQDNPNQAIQQTLSNEEKQLLADAGNQWQSLGISSIVPAQGLETELRYKLIDTLGFDSVLVYSPGSDFTGLYTATFADLGPGNGDYIVINSVATGNIYQWIAPVNGEKQGRYQPIRRLVAPNQLQVISLRAENQSATKGQFMSELAFSGYNDNRFSPKSQTLSTGTALRLGWKGIPAKRQWEADYQFNQGTFKTVERIRQVEFARDWNLQGRDEQDMHLTKLAFNYAPESGNLLKLSANAALAGSDFKAIKPEIYGRLKQGNWSLGGSVSALFSQDSLIQKQFLRQKTKLAYRWGLLNTAWASEGEYNAGRPLQSGAYRFFDQELYQEWADSSAAFYSRWGVFLRNDDSVLVTSTWASVATAKGLRTHFSLKPNANLGLTGSVQFRQLELKDKASVNALISRLQYRHKLAKNAINLNTLYESGISNEPLRSFSFIKVADGTGTYIWIDYNLNGIQELNEFELATLPGEGNYIRFFSPGRSFISAGRTLISQQLAFQPSAWLKSRNRSPMWSLFSFQWNYSLENTNVLENGRNALNPFFVPAADSLQLSRRITQRFSVFFQRAQSKLGGDFSVLQNQNQQVLGYGLERTNLNSSRLQLRYRPIGDLLFNLALEQGDKNSLVPGFPSRNFQIAQQNISTTATLQFRKKWRTELEVGWQEKANRLEGREFMRSLRQKVEIQYSLSGNSQLTATLDRQDIVFNGQAFSNVGFEMLQGLQAGTNWLWKIYWDRNLFDFLQLNFQYDGRQLPGSPIVHTGSMQIKALF